MNIQANQTLDTSGLSCPLPILRTRKALSAMSAGEMLEVRATDPGSVKDMQAFCQQTGDTLLTSDAAHNSFVFFIQKS